MKRLNIHLVVIASLTSFMVSCGGEKSPANQDKPNGDEEYFTIYLIRHAQAYKNITPLPDLPPEKLDALTPEGEKQADALGNYLKDKSIDMIYASPTGRTKQTAERISTILGNKNGVIADINFSSLTKGKTPEGLSATWSWRVEQWDKGEDPRPIGGESLVDGQKRVVNKLKQIAETLPAKTIIVVTHGDICSAILAYTKNTPIWRANNVHQMSTGSASEIIINQEGWDIILSNYLPLEQF